VQAVVKELNKQGWAAQLRHIEKETTRENHGFVKLRDAATDSVLAETADLQHNRNYGKMADLAKELVKNLPPPASVTKPKETVEEGEEASTKAASDSDEASLKASDEEASVGKA